MFDDDDVGEVLDGSLFSSGWVSAVLLLIAIVLMFVVCGNKKECAQLHCQDGSAAVLMDHACRCVSAPVPATPVNPAQ